MASKRHSGFGIIAQAIVGAVQGIALGSGKAYESSMVDKYLKKEGHTQAMTQASELELKQRELATKQRLLQAGSKTELLKDQELRKLVIIGGGVALGLTILGLTLFILFATKGEGDE